MKPSNTFRIILAFLALTFFLSACGTPAETATPAPALETDFTPVISATGKVTPRTWATLSLQAGGVIANIAFDKGEQITEGDVLISLEGESDALAAVAAARMELIAAQIALKDLQEADYALLAAQSLQAMNDAQDSLDDLQNPELQQALALQAIAEAEEAVDEAAREVNRVKTTASQAAIDEAKAAVILTRDALEKAEDNYEPWEDKPEDNLTRATLLAKLSAAQQAYDDAVRRLNALSGTGDADDIAIAEAKLSTAVARLSEAQRHWEDIKDGPDSADIALLEAQIAAYQEDYEQYLEGADPDEIALAEARIENAEAQLAAAQFALDKLQLRAPFDGTVSDILVNPAEFISPGQPVLVLADLANLRVETTDLNEIDVAQVETGRTVTVTFDAIPGLVANGTVIYIAPKATEGAGVNYTVVIELDEIPSELRWGMTAFVDIETEE